LIERDIENLWAKYEKFLGMLQDKGVNNLLEAQGQRIAECSFSQREKEPFCGMGGILEYSLELLKNAKKLNESLGYQQVPRDLISATLLSPIGYIGTINLDRYVLTTSEWHKEKLGQYFDWNEACPKYKIQDMTLWFLQKYNIALDWNVWQAISLLNNIKSEENKFYGSHKDRLALLVSLAHEVTLKNEFDKLKDNYTTPF
tara:strand:+ start:43 stop:645 length:603 start_codon:yes stop_codon:yes gene_type:complete